jgi:hypothetical protein
MNYGCDIEVDHKSCERVNRKNLSQRENISRDLQSFKCVGKEGFNLFYGVNKDPDWSKQETYHLGNPFKHRVKLLKHL